MDIPPDSLGLAQNVIALKTDIHDYAKAYSGAPISDVETRVRELMHEHGCVDTSGVPGIAQRIVERNIEGLFIP